MDRVPTVARSYSGQSVHVVFRVSHIDIGTVGAEIDDLKVTCNWI